MIKLEPLAEKKKYRTLEDTSFFIGRREIFIPLGFEFDGASIPRLFWSIIGSPFDPDFMEAALIHDYCFITKCCGFVKANNLFKSKLKKDKVGFLRRITMWSAVASAGLIFWNRQDIVNLKLIHNLIKYRFDWFKFECDINAPYYIEHYQNGKGIENG